MDDRTWWQRHRPAELLAIWRWRHSEEYRTRMAGYWKGHVCRFCDRSFADGQYCDIGKRWPGGRPCDFRKGSRRGILGPR